MNVEEIKLKIQQSGYKLTKQRHEIIAILCENKSEHFSCADLYRLTIERHPEIGIATIYRTVQILEKIGLINRADFRKGISRFELNDQETHTHHHLICKLCGHIREMRSDDVKICTKSIKEEEFKITEHVINFFGYCKHCQTEIEQDPESCKI